MGTIYKRRGIYYVNLMVDGKRVRKKVGKSKRIAMLALKDLEVKAAKHEYDFTVPDTHIDDLFRAFLEFSETNHAPATHLRYNNVITNVQIFLAIYHPNMKRISQLKLPILEKYKRFRKTVDPRTLQLPQSFPYAIKLNSNKASSRTLNYEIKTLRSIFNFGVRSGLCRGNPVNGLTTVKVTDSKQPRFLTYDECDLLFKSCDDLLYPVFFTFLNTGLRLGELINLQWADIDFSRRKLIVRKKEFWTPKAGEREIPLSSGLFTLLKDIMPQGVTKTDFVFPGKDGGKLKRKLRKDHIRVAQQAGLDDVTKVHSLRHTFASHLVMKGVDLPTVQKLLGHSDIKTTMIYAHLAPDHLVDAVDKLEFSGTGGRG